MAFWPDLALPSACKGGTWDWQCSWPLHLLLNNGPCLGMRRRPVLTTHHLPLRRRPRRRSTPSQRPLGTPLTRWLQLAPPLAVVATTPLRPGSNQPSAHHPPLPSFRGHPSPPPPSPQPSAHVPFGTPFLTPSAPPFLLSRSLFRLQGPVP
jgi:hypothetical protein